jgi:hypothetical protein
MAASLRHAASSTRGGARRGGASAGHGSGLLPRLGGALYACLFWLLLLPAYGLLRILRGAVRGAARGVAFALACKWPMSMPRKVLFSVLLLLGLLASNYATLAALNAQARSGVQYLHFESRVSVLLARARFLSQELVYAASPLVTGAAPQPPPAPAVTSTTPDPAALAAALRAVVSTAQMTHAAVLAGTAFLSPLPGTGDGVLDASELDAAGIGALAPAPAAYGSAGAGLDAVYWAELLAGFALSPAAAAALPAAPPASSLSGVSSALFFSDDATALLLMPQCLRAGGTLLGSAAAREQTLYAGSFDAIRRSVGSPFNTSWPVVLPANPAACPGGYLQEAALAQNGLDVALKSLFSKAWLLANQTGPQLVPWNPYHVFVQNAAALDAAGAWSAAAAAAAAVCVPAARCRLPLPEPMPSRLLLLSPPTRLTSPWPSLPLHAPPSLSLADGIASLVAGFASRAQQQLAATHLSSAIFFVSYLFVVFLW